MSHLGLEIFVMKQLNHIFILTYLTLQEEHREMMAYNNVSRTNASYPLYNYRGRIVASVAAVASSTLY